MRNNEKLVIKEMDSGNKNYIMDEQQEFHELMDDGNEKTDTENSEYENTVMQKNEEIEETDDENFVRNFGNLKEIQESIEVRNR